MSHVSYGSSLLPTTSTSRRSEELFPNWCWAEEANSLLTQLARRQGCSPKCPCSPCSSIHEADTYYYQAETSSGNLRASDLSGEARFHAGNALLSSVRCAEFGLSARMGTSAVSGEGVRNRHHRSAAMVSWSCRVCCAWCAKCDPHSWAKTVKPWSVAAGWGSVRLTLNPAPCNCQYLRFHGRRKWRRNTISRGWHAAKRIRRESESREHPDVKGLAEPNSGDPFVGPLFPGWL